MNEEMVGCEVAERICAYCRREIGDQVRSVIRFSSSDHDPLYTREDVSRQLQMDDDTRSMFRTPFVQVNKTIWQIGQLSPTLGEPECATFDFGQIGALLLPIRADEGVIVTLDWEGKFPKGLVDGCKEIAYS